MGLGPALEAWALHWRQGLWDFHAPYNDCCDTSPCAHFYTDTQLCIQQISKC